jgi:hypothetical protein
MQNKTILLTFIALALGGNAASAGSAGGTVVVAGTVNDRVAAAGGCAQAISAFEAIIDSDAQTGNLNKTVHRRVVADLAAPKSTCAAGRDADASRQLSTIKARYGYR